MSCENCGNENVKIINTVRNTYVCEKCGRDTESLFEIKLYKEIRNKVIEEFVKFEDYLMDKIKEEIVDVNIDYEWRKVVCLDDIGTKLREGLREIAEKMKEVEE